MRQATLNGCGWIDLSDFGRCRIRVWYQYWRQTGMTRWEARERAVWVVFGVSMAPGWTVELTGDQAYAPGSAN